MCGLPRALPETSDPGFQYYKAPNTDNLGKDVTGRWTEDGTFSQTHNQHRPFLHLPIAQEYEVYSSWRKGGSRIHIHREPGT